MRGLFDSQGVGAMSLSDPSQDPMGWLRKYRERSLEDDAIDASGVPEVWQGYSERRAAEDEFGKYSKLAQAAAAEMAGLVPTRAAGSPSPEPSPIDVQNRFFDDWAAEGQRRRAEPDFSGVRSGSYRGSSPAIEEPGTDPFAGRGLGVSPGLMGEISKTGRPAIEAGASDPEPAIGSDWRPGRRFAFGSWRDVPAPGPSLAERWSEMWRSPQERLDYEREAAAKAGARAGGAGPLPRSGASPARSVAGGDPSAALLATLPRIETEDLGPGTSRLTYPTGVREWISDPHRGSDGTEYGRASITAKPGASGPRGVDFLRSGSALLSSPQRFAAGPPAIETASVVPAGARYDAMGNRVAAGGSDQSAGHVANVGGGSDWRQEMALEEQRQAADLQRRAPALTRLQEQAKLAELHRAIDDPYALERFRALSAANVEGIRRDAKIGAVAEKASADRAAEMDRRNGYIQDAKRIQEDFDQERAAIIKENKPDKESRLQALRAMAERDLENARRAYELGARFRASDRED